MFTTIDTPVTVDTHPNDSLCLEMQREEYEVLESIYPDCIMSQPSDQILKLEIPIEFDSPKQCWLRPLPSADISTAVQPISLIIERLPPLQLQISLPIAYPRHSPPEIVSIRATSGWLSDPSSVSDALLKLWHSDETVLDSWVEYVRSAEFLRSVENVTFAEEEIIICHLTPEFLARLLSEHQTFSKLTQFNKLSYDCSVCLSSFKGSKCLQLSCQHIFCRSCLEDFWKMCIEEGDICRVGCPDPGCVKEAVAATEEDVAKVVSAAELQRWKALRLKRLMESDPTIQHCPIMNCQNPVPKPEDADPNSGWDRFRQCPHCSFSFCSFCKHTWHGPISPCPIAHTNRLLEAYLSADPAEKAVIENRHGRSRVLQLVVAHEQEQLSNAYVHSATTACPGCETRIEKSMGCNHMTCWKCHQHFCYRCGVRLDKDHPYDHFSLKATRCFNKLFDYDPSDLNWDGW